MAYALYLGSYYRACLYYALSLVGREQIFILSAKYGLLALRDVVEPYDLKMGQKGSVTAQQISEQAVLRGVFDEKVICLGGRAYIDVMRQVWKDCVVPLEGVGGIGKQMRWLKQHRGMSPCAV